MVLKASWANLQLVDFNKDSIFEEALESLGKKKIEEFYFLKDKEPTEKDFDKWHQLWKDLWEITKKYIERNSKKIFEYKYTYEFYYKHLAANIVVFYLMTKLKIKQDLRGYILEKIIKDGYFISPIDHPGKTMPDSFSFIDVASFYLALKWFLNDKTKHYYSEELLKEMEEYEDNIKDSMDPNWREKYKSPFHYRLRY